MLLGRLGDTRRRKLVLSSAKRLMGLGTLFVGATPLSASMGPAALVLLMAPLDLCIGRRVVEAPEYVQEPAQTPAPGTVTSGLLVGARNIGVTRA